MKEEYRKAVRIWLMTGAVLVIAMVVIGGITRLTHSGLSMTNWKPITGVIPPLNEDQWQAEFDNYKQYPEYRERNLHFELQDFKGIFWWEYIHRLLGRFIGMVFLVPYIFFLWKRIFNRHWNFRLLVLFGMGGLQGFIGWFMVKSGLVDNPAVSHFRLAIHFATALTLYGYILWLYWESGNRTRTVYGKNIHLWSLVLLSATAVQIIYGAFVAGLKAGLYINTWPKMGNTFISPLVGRAFGEMGILAAFEDGVTVQFIHRTLPYLLLLPVLILLRKCREMPYLRRKVLLVGYIWLGQFILGVITLLLRVPVSLGVLHQLGSVILLTSVLSVIYSSKASRS